MGHLPGALSLEPGAASARQGETAVSPRSGSPARADFARDGAEGVSRGEACDKKDRAPLGAAEGLIKQTNDPHLLRKCRAPGARGLLYIFLWIVIPNG